MGSSVIVVGAGITGCSVAYELASRGCTDVTVLDKGYVASGPTGLSSGIIRQFYTHPVLVQMARQGRDTYAELKERVGGSAGFVECGWLLAVPDAARPVADLGLQIQANVGVDSRWVSPADVTELVPGVVTEGVSGGVYEPTAGYADPAGTAQALLEAARSLGVQYFPGVPVERLVRDGDTVVGVETQRASLRADVVIVAAGPWTGALTAPLSHDIPVTASRHSVVTVRERKRPTRPVFSDPVNLVYTRPEGTGFTLIGGNDPADAKDLVDPDCCPPGAAPVKIERLLHAASQRLPSIADAGITAQWSGVYDVSEDGFPLLGPLAGLDGVLIATGMSGHGFKLAPAIGEILARAVLDAIPDPRMHLFRPERFGQDDLVQSVTTSSLTSMSR